MPTPAEPPAAAPSGSALLCAARLLLRGMPPNGDTADARRGDPRPIARWIVPLGLIIGMAWMGVFRVAWRFYGDPENTRVRLLPALAVTLLECGLTGRVLLRGLSRAVESPRRDGDPAARNPDATVLVGLCVLSLWALLVAMPERVGWYPSAEYWRSYVNPFFPLVTYRPLILAPLWGRWAILLAGSVGRTAASADPNTRALCAAIHPGMVLRWAVVPFVLTALYTLREGRVYEGLFVGLIVFLAAYLTALFLARRGGGQSADSLFGCAAVTQLVFLAAYRGLCAA